MFLVWSGILLNNADIKGLLAIHMSYSRILKSGKKSGYMVMFLVGFEILCENVDIDRFRCHIDGSRKRVKKWVYDHVYGLIWDLV